VRKYDFWDNVESACYALMMVLSVAILFLFAVMLLQAVI
jgi:hypothetical protein